MNNVSQRDAFWTKIYEIALKDRDIVIVSADMGAPALDRVRKDIPSQFINAGIAEQNAIVLASGLSMSGKRVFAYAIAPFITLRCLEQIRVQNAMMKTPLTIVGVGAGFGYEDSGPTHHIIEDIAIMRSLPDITIYSITDSVMASAVAGITCYSRGTNYVRLDRKILPSIYSDQTDFSKGIEVLKESRECYIVATGSMVHMAIEISMNLKNKGFDIGVIDVYKLPINESLFIEAIKNVDRVVTIEEHFLPAGFGSAVCETLIDNELLIPVKRIGIHHNDGYCYKYGGRDEIRTYYGIDMDSIEKTIGTFVRTRACGELIHPGKIS